MASGDYRLCDVCDCKVFYDVDLGYEVNREGNPYNKVPYKIAGENQYGDKELSDKYGISLQSLGDWAVICKECSKEYKTQIVKIEKVEE